MAKSGKPKAKAPKKSEKKPSNQYLIRLNPVLFWRSTSKLVKITVPIAFAVLVMVLAVLFWYYRSYQNPGNVFWGMVGDNLKVSGVTKEVKQQSPTSSTDDIMQVSFTPGPILHALRQVSSPGQKVKLSIESYNTPTESYQHYAKIERPSAPGIAAPDYNRLYKLWLKNPTDSSTSSLFGNAVFGVALIGNVPQPQRAGIISLLHQAYQVDTSSVQVSEKGRRTYTYDVSIRLKDYALAAHDYAKAFNLPTANTIKPADYKESDTLQVSMTIDASSRHLVKVVYKSGSLTETYGGYGLSPQFTPPSHTVTPAEFEKTFRQVLGA